LGRSDVRLARSLCRNIIEHLLKPEFPGLQRARRSLARRNRRMRRQLEQILTRNIETKLDLLGCHKPALRLFRFFEREVAALLTRLTSECPTQSNRSRAPAARTGSRHPASLSLSGPIAAKRASASAQELPHSQPAPRAAMPRWRLPPVVRVRPSSGGAASQSVLAREIRERSGQDV
jgi:hypothetical protein